MPTMPRLGTATQQGSNLGQMIPYERERPWWHA